MFLDDTRVQLLKVVLRIARKRLTQEQVCGSLGRGVLGTYV
jgi:hypothetical protein